MAVQVFGQGVQPLLPYISPQPEGMIVEGTVHTQGSSLVVGTSPQGIEDEGMAGTLPSVSGILSNPR